MFVIWEDGYGLLDYLLFFVIFVWDLYGFWFIFAITRTMLFRFFGSFPFDHCDVIFFIMISLSMKYAKVGYIRKLLC